MADATNFLCLRRSSRTQARRLSQLSDANPPTNLKRASKREPARRASLPSMPSALHSKMITPALIAGVPSDPDKVFRFVLDGTVVQGQDAAMKGKPPYTGPEPVNFSGSPSHHDAAVISDPPSQPPSLVEDPADFSDTDSETPPISYDRDYSSDGVLRLKPTLEQWQNFTAVLSVARNLGAYEDGCFKVLIPEGATGPLPQRAARTDDANAFKPHLIKGPNNFRVHTIMATESFPATPTPPNAEEYLDPKAALEKLRRLFSKSNRRQLRRTRYRVDVPAWTSEQRLAAGVPEESPIYPLLGDRLDKTKAIIPGIHTPYVYESGPAFGATFQIHAEDYRLLSLNHLYLGRKIWVIVPSMSVDQAEKKLERGDRCSQFMRHRAEFFFPSQLDRLEIPHRIIDQRPGETIVILQDAYHEGFSDGYTLAEAKNYADARWNASRYQPCNDSCKLATAIPSDHMKLIDGDEERIDLCAAYLEEVKSQKRELVDDDETETDEDLPELLLRSKGGATKSPIPRPSKMSRLC